MDTYEPVSYKLGMAINNTKACVLTLVGMTLTYIRGITRV